MSAYEQKERIRKLGLTLDNLGRHL